MEKHVKYGLVGVVIGFCLVFVVGAAVQPTALQLVANNVEVYSLDLDQDKFYIRYGPVLWLKRQCWQIDLSKRKDGPKFGWTTAAAFIDQTYAFHSIRGTLLEPTAESKEICERGLPKFIVAVPLSAMSRDLYDGDLWLADLKTWTKIGSVSSDAVCEEAVIRKTPTLEYHWVTNSDGVRGLASCKGP